jgi:hypothetical protein
MQRLLRPLQLTHRNTKFEKVPHAHGPHRISTVYVNGVFVIQLSVPQMGAQKDKPQRRATACATTGGTDS